MERANIHRTHTGQTHVTVNVRPDGEFSVKKLQANDVGVQQVHPLVHLTADVRQFTARSRNQQLTELTSFVAPLLSATCKHGSTSGDAEFQHL